MDIRCAKPDDIQRIVSFYQYAIDDTPHMAQYARWVYGQHPTDPMVRAYIEQSAMYILEESERIVAAMALTMSQGEDYHGMDWGFSLKDDEVAVVHILCVSPDYQRQGIGKRMIAESIRLAEEKGKKAIRLDALASNTPAHRMYESMGLQLRGKRNMYAENTGWTDFLFFELQI